MNFVYALRLPSKYVITQNMTETEDTEFRQNL